MHACVCSTGALTARPVLDVEEGLDRGLDRGLDSPLARSSMSKTFMGHMSTSCEARSPVTG